MSRFLDAPLRMLRRVYGGIDAYRRDRRDAARESIMIFAIGGILMSAADNVVGHALAWRWPSVGEQFNALSKNLRVVTSGLPLALLWFAAAFGWEWRSARQRAELQLTRSPSHESKPFEPKT